ncbi:Molecular chaperone IbpA, HSP20 family [Enhydrobacter aerosaccus]|uniref:Molecular chaperone IbpA, HSP20 family n=1 Tax=Enhydrobacter aerosaccus TaxID=225324 RepID=A0A1T4KQ64_9HYPH|nr:Hsp20/alpha crystallin family protein [Enhydrobacter aerosaccus]SJZ44540.1 Molecular chaperone IbpA, HSP20 family [Enhydrobacter aerosaccus]
MSTGDPRNWMWSEALQMLARAEQLHREMFNPPIVSRQSGPAWEPPTDMLETDDAVLILVALPGVDPQKVQLIIRNGVLAIAGERILPPQLRTARIHRLELPQGRFERQIALPTGRYEQPRTAVANGCLAIELRKAGRGGTP